MEPIREFRISGTSDQLCVEQAGSSQATKLNADGFFRPLLRLPSKRCIDLLRIAAGIHTVDRIVKRRKRKANEEGTRRLHLEFEVKEPDFWASHDVQRLILGVLTFLTDDDWSIGFKHARRAGDHGNQDFLDLPRPFEPAHAALYSGGLDSAAGLASRLLEGANDFILVTVGHQSGLHTRVSGQIATLTRLLDARMKVQTLHSTLRTALHRGKAKRMRLQESTQRSRGFFFCSSAAVAANAYGLRSIEMLENGVGAINLPLMTGMLGSSLSTRGAHPTFLDLMSQLAGLVTEQPMKFVLPFEAKTKSEMLHGLRDIDGISEWLQTSHSCVHSAIRRPGKTHCGTCPACIERRQAFATAGIKEDVDQYEVDLFTESVPEQSADYFDLYRIESRKCLDDADSFRRRMTNHLRITRVPDERNEDFRELQRRHSKEVLGVFGSPFPSETMSAA